MIGQTLSHYRILDKIGAGGMGEVYLAEDTRLGRKVALKILPAQFTTDADRVRRFEQEARAASALNHPNILTIYDIGTHDGVPYIVSELLEGQTLRERDEPGALPVRKALDYALQITQGLAAAHGKGIVHRDLKPENLFLCQDGRVKILDFGLAKLKPTNRAGGMGMETPTRTQTEPGKVMGTVDYMSPEQARGQEADQRSDIFTIGVILYEMLAGRRAFQGQSAVEAMNAILKEEPPDLVEINGKVSPGLARVVNHCLEKNPDDRFQSATDLAFALEALSGSSSIGIPTELYQPDSFSWYKRRELGWIAAGVLLIGLLALLPLTIAHLSQKPAEVRPMKFSILQPEGTSFHFDAASGMHAISPDGQMLAFITISQGTTRIWVRPLDSLTARPLYGTENADGLFWSPDGKFIGFWASGRLKRIEVSTGATKDLCRVGNLRGGTWNQQGVIVFGVALGRGLLKISADGGEPSPVTFRDLGRGEETHYWPRFLPDGQHLIYSNKSAHRDLTGIYVATLGATPESQSRVRILNTI